MVNVEWLRYFVAVAETRNFAAAAERLHLTPQALSHAIAGLEQHYQQVLIDRGQRVKDLTPAGQALLAEARTVLAKLENTDRLMQEFKEAEPQGPVRLAGTTILQSLILPPLLARVRDRHAGIVPRIFNMRSADIEVRVASGDLDLGWFMRPARHAGVESRELTRTPYVIVGCPQPPASWHDLDYVAVRHFTTERQEAAACGSEALMVGQWARRQQAPRVAAESDQFETTLGLCLAGVGAALLPELVVRAYVQEGRLAVIADSPEPYDEPITVVWRKGVRLNAAALAVLQALQSLVDVGDRQNPNVPA